MNAKAFAVAAVTLTFAAVPALAQSSGPAKGLPQGSSPQGGQVMTQGVTPLASANDFVTMAASSGMMEVEAGRLAADKATNEQVRAYGQHMVQDHTQSNQQLMALARQQGVEPSATMAPHHAQMLLVLQGLSGAAFDRQYMQNQVNSHNEAVTLYQNASQSEAPGMQGFRSFAAQSLPMLRQHLMDAQALAGAGVPTAKQ